MHQLLSYDIRKVFWTLSTLAAFLLVFYMYFLNQTVLHAVAQEKLSGTIQEIDNKIVDLESHYISLKNSISLQTAYALGFRETDPQFIEKKPLGQANSGKSLQ